MCRNSSIGWTRELPLLRPNKQLHRVKAESAWDVFGAAVVEYHVQVPDAAHPNARWDVPPPPLASAFPSDDWHRALWLKAWVDCVQWHAEDRIRDPHVDPRVALELKRRIDALNQERTDRVEALDDFLHPTVSVQEPASPAWLPTETPGWALDRLSILALKCYHMNEEAERPTATDQQRRIFRAKQSVLVQQKEDLIAAIDALWHAICTGQAPYRRYRQMKMYNDVATNPVLYRTLE